jgi:transcriptional regulator with XRE-family HTH domain
MATSKGAKPPTVRLRRLAAELRRLRAEAELSREQVAAQTGVNEGTLYRLETARARPQRRTLLALLDLYGVSEAVRSDLLDLSKSADGQGWLRPYQSELPEEYAAYINFEAEARSVRNYESLFIPGLLQTEDYARAVITGTLPMASQPEVEQHVRARIERQELLTAERPLELWAIVDEAAVRRMVGGPEVMRGQLLHLREAVDRPNVMVQVITFDAGAHPGMPGAFVYMEFGEAADPELVYVDTLAGELFLEAEADLRRYSQMFNHLRASALSQSQTTDMISTVIEGLERG